MTKQDITDGLKEVVRAEVVGNYAHIFVYRIPERQHEALLNVQTKLSKIYKRHGALSTHVYQLGRTNVFDGFEGFEKALGTSASGEEIWIEVDTYKDASDFGRAVAEIGADADAGILWGELAQIMATKPIIMGEFARLAKE
ncbi:MAG TPA: hypothetical protein VFF30_15055 [Nitrososphaerales archaeon]|nr:hypothetical protein [Nitrososphaerales archaeon]